MPPMELAAPAGPRWLVHSRAPDDWAHHVERLGGGYFHSPAGLDAVGSPGRAVFFQWCVGREVVGIAAGLRHSCHVSGVPLHAYLPTLPVVEAGRTREAAIRSLIEAMRAQGMVELVCDSFHADGVPPLDTGPVEIRRRFEFVMTLDAPAEVLLNRWAPGHRAELEAAERLGWALTLPTDDEVCGVVAAVYRDASPPTPVVGLPHNEPFVGTRDIDLALGTTDLTSRTGRAVFAAWEDGRPLAVAVVGWANRRAYQLLEIVTRTGRDRPVMTWLYSQIVTMLCRHGFTSYHVGVAPTSVADSPQTDVCAVHHDRLGFRTSPVFSASARWVLDPGHAARHRKGASAGGRLGIPRHGALVGAAVAG